MVMASIIPKHVHNFDMVKNRGTCKCGEIRDFITGENLKDSKVEIIQHGNPNYQVNHPAIKDSNPAKLEGNIPNNTPEAKHRGGAQTLGKHKFIESHKAEIIKDVETMGSTAALKKWGISPSGWHTIRKRWGVGKFKKPTQIPEATTFPIRPSDYVLARLEAIEELNKNPKPAQVNSTIKYLVDYWRKRAANKNTSDSERVLMVMTADALEAYCSVELDSRENRVYTHLTEVQNVK
jgi:hypothetical protein